ncbi:Nucleoprotein TPR [Taenia crassiceps]|uniref:Nucleoprotein TPR n=1 Tax=Taenia crassiceps TaxID=6207 RepID=A0ABR4QGL1_9CEST
MAGSFCAVFCISIGTNVLRGNFEGFPSSTMDALIQLAHLSEEDLLSLSERVAENLAIAFDSLSHEVLEAKDRLKRSEEEQKNEISCLQGECSHLRNELDSLNANTAALREALAKEENKCLELVRERDNLNQKLGDSLSVSTELELVIKNLENDKESLSELLNKRMLECEQKSAELREIQNEVRSARRLKSDAMTQLEEVKTEKALLALREKRLEETSESMKKHNLWLEEELHKANDKLLSFRRDNSERFLNLESDLVSRKTELENAQAANAKLEDLVKQLTKSNDDHIEKLKLRTDELANMEQLHANELEAQRRLTNLYKDQASEVEKKYEEIQKAVTEMQELLKRGHEHVFQLQLEKNSVVNAMAAEKDKLMSENAALARELAAAKEIVDKFRIQGLSEDELRRLNPAVATTIASLKRGRSLTEIYSDYVQVVEERDLLKLDKERLTEHIREIMTQLEEKAPLLRSQQEAFCKSRERVAELETQLEAALTNLKEKQDIAEDQRRRSGYFQRQNKLLKQSCKDLSTQVKTLLHELETARGTVITSTEEGTIQAFPDSSTGEIDSRRLLNLCSADNSTAALVIDNNLVTFRTLSDLQTQNARLLLVARDLAAQLEDHESTKDVLANQVSEITAKVEVLSGEVDVARLAALEARSEANFATRQRDAYKTLLQRHAIPLPHFSACDESPSDRRDNSAINPHDTAIVLAHLDQSASTSDRISSSTHQSQTIVKLEESLCSLHAEFKQYREDKAKSDEVYTNMIEKLRRESTEARVLNQKLAAQLDFTHEKFRTLESNVSSYKQEISILREMNARYTTSAAASDEALAALREQSARTSDRLAAAEVECRQLIRQLEHARANEARLSHELEVAQKAALMHEKLMHQLQSIQANLEHREEIEAQQATRHIEALETKLEELKKSSEDRQEQLLTLNTTLQSELAHTRQVLRTAEEEASQLRAVIAADKSSSLTSNTGPSDLQVQSSSLSASDQPTSADVTSDDGAQPVATQLRNLEHECASLRVTLEAVRKQYDEYKQLGIEMETHIAKLTKERESLEHTHAREMEDASQRCELLSLQLVLEKSERQDLINEKTRLAVEYQALLNNLREDLASAQSALRAAEVRQEAALKLELSAHSEAAAHQKTAQEAREKYETELRLHAQDVQLLTEARKLADEARAEVEGLRVTLETAKVSLQQSEEQLTVQANLWEESRARLVKRVEDADAEISRLQEQILTLTEQIVSLRKLMDRSTDQSFCCEESNGQIKESEDFMHLLEYLRRQKSIAEAAEESANAEVSRLHLRTKALETQVADLEAKLAEERRRNEIHLETSSQHANLMKQIEQERQTIRNAAVRAEEKLAALVGEMEPLRTRCKELEDTREILVLEKRSLAEERDRWKERCTRLVETSKRMDPEEYKQACNARDRLQATLEATEEAKAIVERESAVRIAALEQQITELSSSLAQRESEGQSFTAKLASLDEKCKAQEDELSKRQVKITKLREIGRKYRQEADELKRQLSSTQEQEKSIKTTEEAMVAVRADLLNAQANLQIEQEQSSMLRQEIDNIQQLVDRVESSPDLQAIKDVSPESLIGGSLLTSRTSATYNRLNHLLSVIISEFYRMRGQAEEQSERLLRMQLIESQLAKTKTQCDELKVQLASVMAAASSEAANIVHSVAIASTETADQPTSSPETVGNVPATKSATSTTVTGGTSWGLRAAATVQPVQTSPPPTVSSASPLSAAARQTAEIRPLLNFVATVLPTTTTGIIVEPQASGTGSSYLSPLNTQHVESTASVLGSVQTVDSQPLSTASMKPFVRFPPTLQPAAGSSSVASEDPTGSGASSLPRCSVLTKRTYAEAIFSDEPQETVATAESCEGQITFPPAIPTSPDTQVSKRLKPVTFSTSPAIGGASVLPVPTVNTTPITASIAFAVETGGAETIEDEIRAEEAVNDGENIEEGREVVDEEPVEEGEEAPLMDFDEGEDTGMEYGREEQDDLCIVTEISNDQLERINQEAEEEGGEKANISAEEGGDDQTDYEADEDVDDDDDGNEDEEVEEAEDEEEEQEDRRGTNIPVIILSSGEEVNEDEDGEVEVESGDESNAEDGEGEDEDDVEEAEEGEGDEDVRSAEEADEVESQNEDTEGDDVESKAPEEEEDLTRPTTVTPPSSQSTSLFSQSGIEAPSVLFSSTMPTKSGGLFSNLKLLTSTDTKPSSLFSGMVTSAPRGTFASILTRHPQPGGTFIRQPIIPGPASLSSRFTTPSSVGEMAPGPSKQKIRPIVWTESSDVSRKHSAPPPSSIPTPGLFGPPPGGVLGRRKNWGGPFGSGGGGVGRGASRGSHR